MPKVTQAPRAERDLDEIWQYIAQDNVRAADRMIDQIVAACEMLAKHPLLGESRPDLAPELRAFVLRKYVVLYRPAADGIEVARVVHGARDIESLF